MSGPLVSIFWSHWTVKSHSILKLSLSATPSSFCSYQLLALCNPHLPQSCQWLCHSTLSCRPSFLPSYSVCTSLPHSLTTWATVSPFLTFAHSTLGILLCDQYEIFKACSWVLHIRASVLPFKSPFAIHCQVLSQSIPSLSLTYSCPIALFAASIHSPSPLLHSLCTPLGPQPLRCWLHCYLQLSWVLPLHHFSHTNSSYSLLSSRSSYNWSGLFLPSFWVLSGNITSRV